MRTTLSLDDDIAKLLDKEIRRSGNSFKQVVNHFLRPGLTVKQPIVWLLMPGEQQWLLFRKMVVDGQAAGPLISDAELAALTIEYGGVLHTADKDPTRFSSLRWRNPPI